MAKAVLAWLFVAGANAILVGATALAIALLGVAGAAQKGAFVFPILAFWAKVSLACIPVLAIQHASSVSGRSSLLFLWQQSANSGPSSSLGKCPAISSNATYDS